MTVGSRSGVFPAAGDRVPVVTTSRLTRNYGGTGLFDVDLEVQRGSIYGLVGPNGAGKTTLLSLLCGIRRADRGTVTMSVERKRIAVCPDVPEFDGWLTAYEVVAMARSLAALTPPSEDPREALTTAGLSDAMDRRVGGFSRGMMQRLGLACALAGNPALLILDEPTSALDPAGRAEILGLVAAMRGSRTVIFSSHILADVQRVADHVGILRDGRLLYQGPTQELIDTHLKPRWTVRIAGDVAPVADAVASARWAVKVERAGADTIRIDATSLEAGERGIPAAIAACGARQDRDHTCRRRSAGVGQVQPVGGRGRLHTRGHAKLAEDVGDMHAGGFRGYEQFSGDLLVAAPGCDQAQYFDLPGG